MTEQLEFPRQAPKTRGRGIVDIAIGVGLIFLLIPRLRAAVAATATTGELFDVMAIQVWVVMGLLGLFMIVNGLRRLREKAQSPVRVSMDSIEIDSKILFNEIYAWVYQSGERGRLMLTHGDRLIILNRETFEEGGLDRLFQTLRMRLGERCAELDQRGGRSMKALNRPAIATQIILGAVALGFLAELWAGRVLGPAGDFDMVLVRLGAAVPTLIGDGQWDRLLTASILHGGLLHIGINAVALHGLGGLLERLVGPTKLIAIYLLSCLGGAATSTLLSNALMAVGASTGIFGLLGAFAVLHLRHAEDLPLGFRQSRRWWIFIIGLNAALPIMVPVIDGMAHLGGFLIGALTTWVLISRREDLDAPPASSGVKILTGFLIGLFVAGFSLSGYRAAMADELALISLFDGIVNGTPADEIGRETLNNLAWFRVVDKDATRPWLEAAERAAAKATSGDNTEVANRLDTHATALHRLGRRQEAATEIRRVMALRDDPFTATQMARFLDGGAPIVMVGSGVPELRLTDLGQTVTATGVGIPTQVYAVVKLGETRLGLLKASIPAEGGVLLSPAARFTQLGWPTFGLPSRLTKGARFEVVWIEPGTEEHGWTFWENDVEAAKLP